MICLTFRVGVSLVPFQIFFAKVMVLLFHHAHGSMLAAPRCACWKTALGVVWSEQEAVKWPGVFFT